MAKLAFLLPELRSGGVQKVVTLIANKMDERGHDVEMIVLEKVGELLDSIRSSVTVTELTKSNRVRAIACGILADPGNALALSRYLFAIRPRSHTLSYLPSLASHLERTKPDTLFSATPMINFEAALARDYAKVSTRLVLSERTHLSTGKDAKLKRLEKLGEAMAHCYRKADAIIAVSRGVADDLAKALNLDRDSIDVLHNPTIPTNVPELSDHPVDHPWFHDSEVPLILAVGRVAFQKDYVTLIKALAVANARRPVRLAIVGATSNTKKRHLRVDALMDLAREHGVEERIAFLGWHENPFPYIARATMLVLSSRWEGLPNVLLEALACGTPIVSTDCPSGPDEILDGGRYGRLVPVGDAEALGRGILETLEAPPSREFLLERARQFDQKSSLDGYERILLGNRKKPEPSMETPLAAAV